jgi:hypothetical protein
MTNSEERLGNSCAGAKNRRVHVDTAVGSGFNNGDPEGDGKLYGVKLGVVNLNGSEVEELVANLHLEEHDIYRVSIK